MPVPPPWVIMDTETIVGVAVARIAARLRARRRAADDRLRLWRSQSPGAPPPPDTA